MKYLWIFILLIISVGLFANPANYTAPNFMQKTYDFYTNNYYYVPTVSRAQAGIACNEGYGLNNPALLTGQDNEIYIEYALKNSIDEPNQDAYPRKSMEMLMLNGIVAIRRQVFHNFNMALSIGLPQSASLNSFDQKLHTGYIITKEPLYYNLQTTLGLAYTYNNVTLGSNVLMNKYRLETYRNYFSFEDISEEKTIFNIQPGLLVKLDKIAIGLTGKPKVSEDFNMKVEKYHVTIPAQLAAGLSYEMQRATYMFDYAIDFASQQNKKYDDIHEVRAGLKYKAKRNLFLNGGIAYKTAPYDGKVMLPVPDPNAIISGMEDNQPDSQIAKVDGQDSVLFACGFEAPYKQFTFYGSGIYDTIGVFRANFGIAVKMK